MTSTTTSQVTLKVTGLSGQRVIISYAVSHSTSAVESTSPMWHWQDYLFSLGCTDLTFAAYWSRCPENTTPISTVDSDVKVWKDH